MSLEVTIDSDSATFVVRPAYGKPVTFTVAQRSIDVGSSTGWYHNRRIADRFVVGLKGSDGPGFSHHTTFEIACTRALSRARRYDKAYSVPRSIPTTSREMRVA